MHDVINRDAINYCFARHALKDYIEQLYEAANELVGVAAAGQPAQLELPLRPDCPT